MAKTEPKYKPLRDLVLIELDKVDQKKTDSGIFLPENAWHEHEPVCTVIAVGKDVTDFNVGERLLVNPYAILDIQGEETLKLIKDCDILAYV